MNIVILMGRLAADPVERINEAMNFKSVSFTLAVPRNYVNKTTNQVDADFIQCQMISGIKDGRSRTDVLMKYFKKGDPIIVNGSWEITISDKDGQRRYFNTCKVNSIKFVLSNNRRYNEMQEQSNTQYRPTQQPITQQSYANNANTSDTKVVPGKKSSWQETIPNNDNINYNDNIVEDPFVNTIPQPIQTNRPMVQPTVDNSSVYGDTIPQAFDIGIDMSDEFLDF